MGRYELYDLYSILSKLKGEKEIIKGFLDEMQRVFYPVSFAFVRKLKESDTLIREIKTNEDTFGFIKTRQQKTLPEEGQNMLNRAVYMLAGMLEKDQLNTRLKEERDSFKEIAQQRMDELNKTIKNLEKTKSAFINLIEDLSDEIEKRVATEKELRQSEEKYRRIAENINDVVWTSDINLNTKYISPSVFYLTGETPEEHINTPMEKKFTSESFITINKIWSEEIRREKDPLVSKDRSRIIEAQHYRKDGSTIWVAMNISIIRDDSGNPIGLLGVTRNINEQKLAEQALKESEERLSLALKAAKQGLYDLNLVTGNATVNDPYALMLEYDPETFVETNQKWLERIHPDDHLQALKAFHNYVSGLTYDYKIECRQKTRTGKWIWILSIGEIVEYDKNGKPIRMMGTHTNVTDKKKAENDLIKSEQKYRTLFEKNKDGIIIFSVNNFHHFKLLEHNQTMIDMLGYDNLTDDNINPFNFEKDVTEEILNSRIKDVLENGLTEFESQFFHKNGSLIDVDVRAVAINYMGHDAVFNIIREITERKQMERLMEGRIILMEYAEDHTLKELLQKTLALAEDLTKSLIGFYHFIDEEAGEILLNQWSERTINQFCKVTEEIDFHYPIGKAGVWIECINERKPIIHNDYQSLPNKKGMPQGHANVIRELVVPVFRNNTIVAILGIGNKPADYTQVDINIITQLADLAWDIAERKIGEMKLRENEAKYRLIFERSPLGVIHFNEKGVITECNEKFVEIIGSSKELLEGLNMLDLPDKNVVGVVKNVLKGKMASYEGIYESVTAKKTTPLRMLFSPVINALDKVDGGVGLIEDRSSHVQKEEFRQQVEVAKESAKFKQNFLANMSHEIRTPLTGVLGMIDILEQTSLDEKQQEYVNILKNSGESLKEIINQVLDFSKIEAGRVNLKYDVFEFKNILDNAMQLFAGISSSNVKFHVKHDKRIPEYIYADKNRISQVVNNLISNAVKFTQKGDVCLMATLVEHDVESHKIVIRIEVKDTGIGIPLDMLGKLFTPFSQIDENDTRVFEGTGLGLSICKELVNLHGGEIGVKSEYKKGSNFWFTFTAKAVTGLDLQKLATETKKTGLMKEKYKVLFAEDKIVNQKVVSIMLTSMGHEVTLVSNGKEAVGAFEPEKYDIILMDIQMPVMDGITATKMLKSQFKDLPPVVGLSANAFEGDREKYMAMGMDDYLTKPVKREDFNTLIERLFG